MGHLYKRQQWSLISDGVPNQHHHQWDPRPGQFKMGPRLHQDAPWCAESCGNCEYLQQTMNLKCLFSITLYFISVCKYSGLHLRDVRLPLLQGTGCWGVVRVCVYDGLLGEPCVSGDVPHPRHGEVPRHPLAHDRVRVLRSLDIFLFFCCSCCCSWGQYWVSCSVLLPEKHFGLHADSTIALHCWLWLRRTPMCLYFHRSVANVAKFSSDQVRF